MPTLSITITIARRKGATLLMGEIVRHRFRRPNRRDRMLEDHVVRARVVEDDREAIEVLDAALELAAVHHAYGDGELLATDVVQEHVLDVGLAGLGVRGGRHKRQSGARRPRSSPPTHPDHRATQG